MARTISAGLLALALAGCVPTGDGNTDDTAEAPPPILDLLASGDIAACAHPAVMSVFEGNSRVSFEEAEKKLSLTRDQYDAVEPDSIELKEISTTKANKDIAEVKCEANLYAMGHKVGPVEYTVRPQATGDGIVVWFDGTLGGAMELAKLDHESALKRAVPKPAEPAAPVAATDTPSASDTDASEASEPAPMTPYEKAKAALLEDSSTSSSSGN
ncbi:hypothetical protein [Rhizorhabdus wittichii]|uniref:hypothetical protein n=1 Tax=Rhizorhabdus wittichii TaxID=160791 RepID=UPI0012FD49C0|nr:hypothetical protein [Rhizorhabdus wittichii]